MAQTFKGLVVFSKYTLSTKLRSHVVHQPLN